MNTRPQRLDCLIVGGGPAGLTGALYLARFRRNVAVVDAGKSRAASIPRSHNHPGFPNGIAGKSLLQTLRKQAEEYGAKIIAGDVSSLAWTNDCFEVQSTAGVFCASRILLATGITDKAPTIMSENPAYVQEHVRYCPVCDGFEARGLRIAVCGHPKDADPKAEFLRVYSGSVNVVPCVHETDATFAVTSQGIEVTNQNGETARFDLLYPAMAATCTRS
jgi:thioredoxin reductase (NADPH)